MEMSTAPEEDIRPFTMVLVTDQYRCKRLITAGRLLADREGHQLEVVNVSRVGVTGDPEAIEYLFQASREQGASMTVHYSRSAKPERFLARLIQRQRPAIVVTGLPGEGSDLLPKLWTRFSEVDFYMVDHDGEPRPVTIADRVAAGGVGPAGTPHTGGVTPAGTPYTGGVAPAGSPYTGGVAPAGTPYTASGLTGS